MGRSVIPHPNATVTAYFYMEPDEEYYKEVFEDEFADEDERPDFDSWMYERYNDDSEYEFVDFKEWVKETVVNYWPSFSDAGDRDVSRWSENYVLAENAHSEVSISEYCGVVAISLAPRSDLDYYYSDELSNAPLGAHFRKQIADRFERTFSNMTRLGGFSDGTSVYQKV